MKIKPGDLVRYRLAAKPEVLHEGRVVAVRGSTGKEWPDFDPGRLVKPITVTVEGGGRNRPRELRLRGSIEQGFDRIVARLEAAE